MGPELRRDCPSEILGKDLDSKDLRAGVRVEGGGTGAGRVGMDLISHLVHMWPATSMEYSGDSSEPSVCGTHRIGGIDAAGGRAVTNQQASACRACVSC